MNAALLVWVASNTLAIIALAVYKVWSEWKNNERWDRLEPMLIRMSAFINLAETQTNKTQKATDEIFKQVDELKKVVGDGVGGGSSTNLHGQAEEWNPGMPDRRVNPQ